MTNDNEPPLPAIAMISMSAITEVPRTADGAPITKDAVIASLRSRLKREGAEAFLDYIVNTWEIDGIEYGTPVT
ncbi:hypothetical protein EOD42_20405 [Rhodovarius crocodyli]|uniref:Uncharacterized protein n=1 Tax=Rhodovarius crocodyli TaxID=1979269 RepID=A0A437M1V2_9PROT|nr:hypothetical protein [Rhodovarius crocodyli]RVT91690.1 hypothetical protein EOD42_20405 [Rhodovarius crocodyli]